MTALEVILSVLLFILKAIGIILLILIVLLLLALLSVLFVPVKYKAEGSIAVNDDKSSEQVSGDIKAGISWLFHVVSIRIWTRENKLCYYGKLFGKRIVDSEAIGEKKGNKKNKKAKKKEDEETHNAAADESSAPKENAEDNALDERNAEDNADTGTKKALEQKIKAIADNNTEDKETGQKGADADSDKSLAARLGKIYNSIFAKIEKIKFNFIKICDKIKNVNGTREEFMDFLATEESRAAIAEIKLRILKILLHIKPLRLSVNAAFGFPDPALTGQMYGVLCILFSRYGDKININPQFTDVKKPFVTGDFKCSGRIRAAVLLIHAIKIYKIKRLKEFIAFAKGKGKRNGR